MLLELLTGAVIVKYFDRLIKVVIVAHVIKTMFAAKPVKISEAVAHESCVLRLDAASASLTDNLAVQRESLRNGACLKIRYHVVAAAATVRMFINRPSVSFPGIFLCLAVVCQIQTIVFIPHIFRAHNTDRFDLMVQFVYSGSGRSTITGS